MKLKIILTLLAASFLAVCASKAQNRVNGNLESTTGVNGTYDRVGAFNAYGYNTPHSGAWYGAVNDTSFILFDVNPPVLPGEILFFDVAYSLADSSRMAADGLGVSWGKDYAPDSAMFKMDYPFPPTTTPGGWSNWGSVCGQATDTINYLKVGFFGSPIDTVTACGDCPFGLVYWIDSVCFTVDGQGCGEVVSVKDKELMPVSGQVKEVYDLLGRRIK